MKAKGPKGKGATGASMTTFRVPKKPLSPRQKKRIADAKAAMTKYCPDCGGKLSRERVAPDPDWYAACENGCGYRIKTAAP